MRIPAFLLVAAWMLAATAASACSLCGGISNNNSLAYEFEHAQVIVYGHLENPKVIDGTGRGTTEFHVERILKDDPDFPKQKMVVLSRYLPVLDAKSPPKYVMFFRSPKQRLEPYWGKEIAKPAVLDFVAELQRLRSEPANVLIHAAKHFDDADPNVADEAFLVFAKASDKQIAQTAKKLSPDNLRKLIKDPDIAPERLSMFAYLLGACGNADDAELLRTMLKNQSPRHYKAYEGILAGYITIRPKEGWSFAQEMLKNPKQEFLWRYSALRTLRFFYNANPEEAGAQVIPGLAQAINQADIADVAIRDLKTWKRWDHTKLILSCWDKKSHQSEIMKQNIVRYALACPEPECRTFLERARRQDRDLVERMETELK
jgi:hypothetical protein